jgi:hypothetical protein
MTAIDYMSPSRLHRSTEDEHYVSPTEEFQNTPATWLVRLFSLLSGEIHHITREKRFWPDHVEDRNQAEQIALMHSELSEALEGIRDGNPESDKVGGFTQVEEEYADCIIRILDDAHARKYQLIECILAKIEINRRRPPRHGRKF